MGAVLGSRTTTDGVRRFTADMPVTTRNPSASNEVVRSAATDSTALAEAPSAWRIVMSMTVRVIMPMKGTPTHNFLALTIW
jgi:hypothetical protein